ncbi:MAG: hypothetical protein AAGG65_17175 [Pseudomonadota bacterium]
MATEMTPTGPNEILYALDATHTAQYLAMAAFMAAGNISLKEEMNAVQSVVDALQGKLAEINRILEKQNKADRERRQARQELVTAQR